jgi:hypothetical protein
MLEVLILVAIMSLLVCGAFVVERYLTTFDFGKLWARVQRYMPANPFEGRPVAKVRQPSPDDKKCRACPRVGPVDPTYGYCVTCLHIAHSIVSKGMKGQNGS